jgi:hypothetical protein
VLFIVAPHAINTVDRKLLRLADNGHRYDGCGGKDKGHGFLFFMGKDLTNFNPIQWAYKKTMGRVCHELVFAYFGVIKPGIWIGCKQPWAFKLVSMRFDR